MSMTESKRLYWRCRRGMLELDELLQNYVLRAYPVASPVEQAAFQSLLALSDQDLFGFFFGGVVPSDPLAIHVVEQIRRAAGD